MSFLRRSRLIVAGLMLALSFAAITGLLMHGPATMASVCSFADIEEGVCGADGGATG